MTQRKSILVLAALAFTQCRSPDYVMTVHAGTGTTPAMLDWSDPVEPIRSFSVSPDHGTTWDCTAPEGETISPPIPWGITPRTKAGVLWSCKGDIELFADKQYHASSFGGGAHSWHGELSGVAAAPPPDTLVETSFEDGKCTLACPVQVGGECDSNVGTFEPSTNARTGARACRVCATQGGFFGFELPVGPYARGKHVLEAWIRAETSPSAPLPVARYSEFRYRCYGCQDSDVPPGVVIDGHMAAARYGEQFPGPLPTTYTKVHLELTLPSGVQGDFAAKVGAWADGPGACFVMDDLRVTRE